MPYLLQPQCTAPKLSRVQWYSETSYALLSSDPPCCMQLKPCHMYLALNRVGFLNRLQTFTRPRRWHLPLLQRLIASSALPKPSGYPDCHCRNNSTHTARLRHWIAKEYRAHQLPRGSFPASGKSLSRYSRITLFRTAIRRRLSSPADIVLKLMATVLQQTPLASEDFDFHVVIIMNQWNNWADTTKTSLLQWMKRPPRSWSSIGKMW